MRGAGLGVREGGRLKIIEAPVFKFYVTHERDSVNSVEIGGIAPFTRLRRELPPLGDAGRQLGRSFTPPVQSLHLYSRRISAAPSRTPHPAPRNLEIGISVACRDEANSRKPQLTQAPVFAYITRKSCVTHGTFSVISDEYGGRAPFTRFAGASPVGGRRAFRHGQLCSKFRLCKVPIYTRGASAPHLHEPRITNHEISRLTLPGLAAVRLTHEYRS